MGMSYQIFHVVREKKLKLRQGSWEMLHRPNRHSTNKKATLPPGRFLMFMKVPPCKPTTELEGLLPKRSKKSSPSLDKQLSMHCIPPSLTLISAKHHSFQKTERGCLSFLHKTCKLASTTRLIEQLPSILLSISHLSRERVMENKAHHGKKN